MMQKKLENNLNPCTWYSSENIQQELSNEYQHDRIEMVLRSCALDKYSLSIRRVKCHGFANRKDNFYKSLILSID